MKNGTKKISNYYYQQGKIPKFINQVINAFLFYFFGAPSFCSPLLSTRVNPSEILAPADTGKQSEQGKEGHVQDVILFVGQDFRDVQYNHQSSKHPQPPIAAPIPCPQHAHTLQLQCGPST